MTWGRALAVVGLWALGCGGRTGGIGDVQGCDRDLDCKGARICVDFECQDPDSPASRGPLPSGTGGSSSTSHAGSSSAAGASTGRAGASQGGAAVGDEGTIVDVEASALLADRARQRLYAVVTGKAAAHANELVVIDANGGIESTQVLGSDPDSLAMSDDGTRLWVGLHGGLSIREVDLTQSPPLPGKSFALPPGQFADEAVHAGPMVVLPGEPETVAVSLHYDGLSPSFAGLVVLDSGNPRPMKTSGHTGTSRLTGGPPDHLFGFNNLHTGFEFWSVVLDAMGATQTEHDGLVDGFDNDIVYDSGYVLANGGEVIDVANPSAPTRVGKFSQTGLIVPHVADKRAVMLSRMTGPNSSSSFDSRPTLLVLRRLNLETFREDQEQTLSSTFSAISDFVELAPGAYAFIEFNSGFDSSSAPRPRIRLLSAPSFAQ